MWDTTSRGKGREKNIQNIWEKEKGRIQGEGSCRSVCLIETPPRPQTIFSIAEGEHRKDSFNLQPQTPGQQISFILIGQILGHDVVG
jgi:hypothetical protein